MVSAFAFLLALGGCTALALAMPRHHRSLLGSAPSPARTRLARGIGGAELTGALAFSIVSAGPSVGIVQWLGLITSAASIVAIALSLWRPSL